MKCLLIAASHRRDSLNRKLATLAAPALSAQGMEVTAPDYDEFTLPLYNDELRESGQVPEEVKALAVRIAQYDALVFCSPEYNWSYPGSLKNTIDWLSHYAPCPLAGKTALLMSATPSKRGGVMGLNHLKVPLEAVGMHVYPSSFLLGEADTAFDDNGAFASEENAARMQQIVAAFATYAASLNE